MISLHTIYTAITHTIYTAITHIGSISYNNFWVGGASPHLSVSVPTKQKYSLVQMVLFFPSSEFRNSGKLYSSQRVHSCLLLSRPIHSFWMLFIWIPIMTLNEPEMSLLLKSKTNWSYSLAGAIMHVLQELKSVQLPSLALHLSLTWTVYSCYWLYIYTHVWVITPLKVFTFFFLFCFFKVAPCN